MDFKPGYTPHLEEFRSEVAHVLDSVHPDEVRNELARLGWLAAAEPVALGGAGLTETHETIVAEELAARGMEGVMDLAKAALRRVIHAYGSPDQANRFVPVLSGGDIPVWTLRADSPHDLDPANLTISASRDGDDYILEGYGDFVGQGERPGLIWAWAAVEGAGSDAPLAVLVPGDVEGVLIAGPIESIGRPVRRVEFRQVRVPIYSALGPEGTGWDIALSALDSRPRSGKLTSAAVADDLICYAIDTDRDGTPLILEPVRQLILMDAFIESLVAQLMHRRNAWMRSAGQGMTYHAAQADLMESRAKTAVRTATDQVAGPYALLDHDDPRASSLLAPHNEDDPPSSGDWPRQLMAISLGLEKPPAHLQKRLPPRS